MRTVHIRRSMLASPDAARLISALNAEPTTTFPEPGATHFSLSDAQVSVGDGAFLVAYLDDVAVGCGAVRRLDEATAEIKRMYVDPSVRGRGIGHELVEALEHEARLVGVTKIPRYSSDLTVCFLNGLERTAAAGTRSLAPASISERRPQLVFTFIPELDDWSQAPSELMPIVIAFRSTRNRCLIHPRRTEIPP